LCALRRLRPINVHFYLGSSDPKNMPVARAELNALHLPPLLHADRACLLARFWGKLAGGRENSLRNVIKEWFYYFYQCTECRAAPSFCPYGIDTRKLQ